MSALLKRVSKLEEFQAVLTERDADILRKRQGRSEAAAIRIPECGNPKRREKALGDPERFLKTYFADKYERPFERVHREIMVALLEVATYGGKQAVAAPRGIGKSEVVKGMITYLILSGLIRFPIPVCQTTGHAEELYKDFQDKIQNNELLYEDFPEICEPVRALEGAPQRASKQHIAGELTRIIWKKDQLRLANVPADSRVGKDFGGVRMEFYGLDAAIRGINRLGDRPDLVVIDDPETRESAKSDSQIRDRIKAVDQDINGLAGHGKKLSQVMITTIQNTFCLSYRYIHEKPAWMGKRFGWVQEWPHEWNKDGEEGAGLWHEYITLRAEDQSKGDRYGKRATKFFCKHRKAMEAGGKLNSDFFEPQILPDGTQIEYSVWQVIFNEIADTSFEAFCTEYQNDPPEQEQIETLELTAAKVLESSSGLEQHQQPADILCETMGIDIGKYVSWYVRIAWHADATGTIVDYGQIHTVGLTKSSPDKAIDNAILAALEQFAADQDEQGTLPLLTLVDDGYKDAAVNEACRRVESFFPAKGWDDKRFRMPKPSDDKQPFLEAYASQQFDDSRREFWLYNVNTEHWKNWLQERWVQPVWMGQTERTPGSMALFAPPGGDRKFHLKFARSMVSERLEHIPLEGKSKGFKVEWVVKDRNNNHWLDAAGLACAAAGCVGVRLVQIQPPEPLTVKQKPEGRKQSSVFSRDGRPFLVTQR